MSDETEGQVAVVPRLLTFCQDLICDDDDFESAYRVVAVGVRWGDGSCATVQEASPGGPASVTLWHSVDDAVVGLDAYVCGFAPQRSSGDLHAAPQTHGGESG